MLEPVVIQKLQQVIRTYPEWEIVVAVLYTDPITGIGRKWVYIWPHEILDGLQRQYFPKEFRNIAYEGARRGTVND